MKHVIKIGKSENLKWRGSFLRVEKENKVLFEVQVTLFYKRRNIAKRNNFSTWKKDRKRENFLKLVREIKERDNIQPGYRGWKELVEKIFTP